MNKIEIKKVGAGKQISFKRPDKSSFTFYYEKGNQQVDIWEMHYQGKILIPFKSNLPFIWLKMTLKHTIATLDDLGTWSIPTPLGGKFTFSKKDLVQLKKFLKDMEQNKKNKKINSELELRELLNDWSGKLKNHYELDSFASKIRIVDWTEKDAVESYKIEVKFEFQGIYHFMVLEIDKETDERDGLIVSKLSPQDQMQTVFEAKDIENWVFKECPLIKLLRS